jgi:RHS repeat-associated protein
VETATKPNGNVVTSAYYANSLPYTVTEDTSGGTLVSSHTYAYDPDGNKSQDIEKLMSADSSGSYLSHTLGYAYDPQDQVTQVTTDGTATESYTHDAEGDVTAQTVNGTSTSYDYIHGRLETAATGGATADYNYDPLGRLDTVTAAGQTLQSDTYDGFDNLASVSQLNTSTGSMDTTSYTYDSLNRMVSQTDAAGTSSFSYLGLSSNVASESDPGGVSKTYDYTPSGTRLSQDVTGGSGPTGYGYYSYNGHSDVEALTGASGTTTATYGYTAYGNPVTSMFTGADENDATSSSSSTTQPYSAYRFNAMRWDGTSGQYDMGFRNYDPGLNQFASRDMYDGATQDMGLTADPFTGSLYAFGDGNPVSNTEIDGHEFLAPDGENNSVWAVPRAHPSSSGSNGTTKSVSPTQLEKNLNNLLKQIGCPMTSDGTYSCELNTNPWGGNGPTFYEMLQASQPPSFSQWLWQHAYLNISACLFACLSFQYQQNHVLMTTSGLDAGGFSGIMGTAKGNLKGNASAFVGLGAGVSSSTWQESTGNSWQTSGSVADGLGLAGSFSSSMNSQGYPSSPYSGSGGAVLGAGWDVSAGTSHTTDLNSAVPPYWDDITSGVSSLWDIATSGE